ncbi:TPA: phage tail protein [Yersinia enterocolitica]
MVTNLCKKIRRATTVHVIVMDYPYSMDTVTLPAMLWIHRHQPDLIFNPDRRKTGFTFEADILNNATADIMLHLELTEAVRVADVNDRLELTHLDEPADPRGDMLTRWEQAAANTPWAG